MERLEYNYRNNPQTRETKTKPSVDSEEVHAENIQIQSYICCGGGVHCWRRSPFRTVGIIRKCIILLRLPQVRDVKCILFVVQAAYEKSIKTISCGESY